MWGHHVVTYDTSLWCDVCVCVCLCVCVCVCVWLKSIEHLQVLRDEYRSEFQAQHFANLLHILSPDIPEASVVEVGLAATQVSHSGPTTELNSNAGLHNKSGPDPAKSAVPSHEEPEPIRAAEDVLQRQDLCTGMMMNNKYHCDF